MCERRCENMLWYIVTASRGRGDLSSKFCLDLTRRKRTYADRKEKFKHKQKSRLSSIALQLFRQKKNYIQNNTKQ